MFAEKYQCLQCVTIEINCFVLKLKTEKWKLHHRAIGGITMLMLNNPVTSSFPFKVHLTQKVQSKNLDYQSIKYQ